MQAISSDFGDEDLMCLCHKCRRDYITAGFSVRKAQIYQIEMDVCTRCNYRSGFDYFVSPGIQQNNTNGSRGAQR